MVICKLIYCFGISISFFVYRMCYHSFSCFLRYAILNVSNSLSRSTYHSIDSLSLSITDRFIIFITSSLFSLNGLHIDVRFPMSARAPAYIFIILVYIYIQYLFSTSLRRNIFHRSSLGRGLCWMFCTFSCPRAMWHVFSFKKTVGFVCFFFWLLEMCTFLSQFFHRSWLTLVDSTTHAIRETRFDKTSGE